MSAKEAISIPETDDQVLVGCSDGGDELNEVDQTSDTRESSAPTMAQNEYELTPWQIPVVRGAQSQHLHLVRSRQTYRAVNQSPALVLPAEVGHRLRTHDSKGAVPRTIQYMER